MPDPFLAPSLNRTIHPRRMTYSVKTTPCYRAGTLRSDLTNLTEIKEIHHTIPKTIKIIYINKIRIEYTFIQPEILNTYTRFFELSLINAHSEKNCLLGVFSRSGRLCVLLFTFRKNGCFFPSHARKLVFFLEVSFFFLKNEVGRN